MDCKRAWRIAEARAAFRLRIGIRGLDEQCFSSEGFNDEPRMDFPVVK